MKFYLAITQRYRIIIEKKPLPIYESLANVPLKAIVCGLGCVYFMALVKRNNRGLIGKITFFEYFEWQHKKFFIVKFDSRLNHINRLKN